MIELSERQADITRTVAAMIDMAAHGRCEYKDVTTLVVRPDDSMFVVDVGRCILLGLVFLAHSHGAADHEKVAHAKAILAVPRIEPGNSEIVSWLMTIDRAAHFIYAINSAAFGEEFTRTNSHEIVNRFGAGDYGPGVKVVPE